MTEEEMRPWLEGCRRNQPEWWEQVKHLPTNKDKLDAIVMLGVRAYEALGGEPAPLRLRN